MHPIWQVSQRVIASCVEVHSTLGPGLLESAYQVCLAHEFQLRGLSYVRECPLRIQYKGAHLDAAYRFDFVVEDCLVVEVKSVSGLELIHTAQMLTYLRLSGIDVGLLVNFNVRKLIYGVKRLVRAGASVPRSADNDVQ